MKNRRLLIASLALASLLGCAESDADLVPASEVSCDDGVDNDNDGSSDCDDSDCVCEPDQDCTHAVDNDGAGDVDCADSECACERFEENCTDGVDNDGDGLTDCDDTDCGSAEECEVEAGPDDELCGDEIDNDEDGDVDCDDADCPPSAECPGREEWGEECQDGIDNDFDGDIDCEERACQDSDSCCPSSPRGSEGCEDWGPPPMFVGEMSYIRSVELPSDGSPECCFDYDDDGVIDNGFAHLAEALTALEGFDANQLMADAIADDSLTVLIEWGMGAEGNGFWAHLGTNDTDGDGAPDQAFEDRSNGDGVFQVLPESLDEYGAIIQFNIATVDGDVVTAGPSLFRVNIPIETEGFSLDLDLTIENATVQGAQVDDATGIASADQEFELDGELVALGGWMLGGVIPLDQIGALLNDLASDCSCAGFDSDRPVVNYGDDGTTYLLGCAQAPEAACTAEDGPICENITAICEFIARVSELGINDIDTDGNGVGDAMSVGLWLSSVGATLADPPVAD